MIKTALILISSLCLSISSIHAAGIKISQKEIDKTLTKLDRTLDSREEFIAARQRCIDSLKQRPHELSTLMDIGDAYSSFDNDSAIAYFSLGEHNAGTRVEAMKFRLRMLPLLPLAGYSETAVNSYESIIPDSIVGSLLPQYHESGRKLYSYVASYHQTDTPNYNSYISKALACQRNLLDELDPDSDEYRFNMGEYHFLLGEDSKASAYLEILTSKRSTDKNLLARAHHHLSTLARRRGDNAAYTYHLAQSAIYDIETATLEVKSLQELGGVMYDDGDIERAHNYLSTALDNAVRCGATLRMIESSRSLPLIERAHNGQIRSWKNRIYIVLAIMVVLLIGVGASLLLLYRDMTRMKSLQASLRQANRTKEVYISQFLNLCSIYMDKLNQFCKIAERKISAGKVDEFYRMTKSGKFIEEQSSEFYEVFDNAFLHLYPDFVDEVNNLLRPECRISLKDGEKLNTDLRILAFTRMGIDDAASIAQVLNYSLNTIYAYRNRLKSKAVNRETFEADIMKISSAS